MDQNIANYRCSIRSKMWWWPLFIFGLEAAMQNAWLLYRLSPSSNVNPLDFLQFRRQISLSYFQKDAADKKIQSGIPVGRPKTLNSRVPDSVRYDGDKHYVVVNATQVRCAQCGKKVYRKCSKCMVGLHDKCFMAFHIPQ